MKTISCIQGDAAWHTARAGRVTASRICDVMAKIKTGEAAGRRNYRAQIVAEILTGQPYEDSYVSAEMKRGTELEPLARAAYEMEADVMVDQCGFVIHPTIDRSGASPDGLIGEDGLLELKVPNTATHLQYLLTGTIPGDYQLQMLWQMACTERQWCDFVSYEPRLPEHLQIFIRRLQRDEIRIAEITTEVEKFLADADDMVARLPHAEGSLSQSDRDALAAAQARNIPKSAGATTAGECAAPPLPSPLTACCSGPDKANQPELEMLHMEPF